MPELYGSMRQTLASLDRKRGRSWPSSLWNSDVKPTVRSPSSVRAQSSPLSPDREMGSRKQNGERRYEREYREDDEAEAIDDHCGELPIVARLLRFLVAPHLLVHLLQFSKNLLQQGTPIAVICVRRGLPLDLIRCLQEPRVLQEEHVVLWQTVRRFLRHAGVGCPDIVVGVSRSPIVRPFVYVWPFTPLQRPSTEIGGVSSR